MAGAPAIDPKYTNKYPNGPIVIHSGQVELSKDADAWTGSGTIALEWGTEPHLGFKFKTFDLQPNKRWIWGAGKLRIVQWDVIVNVKTLYAIDVGSEDGSVIIGGFFTEPIEVGTGKNLQNIHFHLLNFPSISGELISANLSLSMTEGGAAIPTSWNGRIVFEAIGWKATIDYMGITQTTRRGEGYSVTHAGKLERSDGKLFSKNDPADFLNHLKRFLSFIRGGMVSFPLIEGYDSSGNTSWRKFDASGISTHNYPKTWFPNQVPDYVPEAFVNFVELVESDPWKNSFDRLLLWYIESIAQTRSESAIILTQVALEALAWVYCIEVSHMLSQDGFDKLTASDKFRLVLSLNGIPIEVPRHLKELANTVESKRKNNVSTNRQGPDEITRIRNSLAHGDAVDPNSVELKQASKLALWYLELLLLRLIKYEGVYANIVSPEHERQEFHLPWSSQGHKPFSFE